MRGNEQLTQWPLAFLLHTSNLTLQTSSLRLWASRTGRRRHLGFVSPGQRSTRQVRQDRPAVQAGSRETGVRMDKIRRPAGAYQTRTFQPNVVSTDIGKSYSDHDIVLSQNNLMPFALSRTCLNTFFGGQNKL